MLQARRALAQTDIRTRVAHSATMTERTRSTMRVTTVRFSTDLWAVLEREAALAGVSVSQYIREAALARAVAAAAARDEPPFEMLAGGIRDVALEGEEEKVRAARRALAHLSRLMANTRASEAAALRSEARQARSWSPQAAPAPSPPDPADD